MKPYASLDFAAIGAGWRVLQRHLRYAGNSPRKLLWIARRAVEIVRGGHLFGVLQRHRLVEDFYAEYARWLERDERDADRRVSQYASEMAQWRARPTFSILLPVYCPELPVLEQAVESVRAQQYPEWELRIVDDGSPQRAHVAWLEALAQRDPRVHFVARGANAGIAAATNDALAAASGDFCVFLDQDDLLARCALFEFAAQLARTPSAALLYADEDRINERGDRSRPAFKPDWDPEWLRATNYVLHPVAVRTTLLRRLGGLRTGLDGVQDWDLLLRVAEAVDHDALVHMLRELVTQALRPTIGMVGAMLFYPNNTIQHAGVVLGLNGVADRPYVGYPSGFRGVDGRLGAVHCVESMITACAALRRDTYAKVGGMDESLPVACNDLDLCLRVGALGLLNLMTPFAQLYHAESASRGYHYGTRHALQETRDEARFRLLHGERLGHDRFYNPNLTLRGPAYALAWSAEDRSALQRVAR